MTTAPRIYVRTQHASLMPWPHRLIALVVAMAGLTVLILAAHITPAAGGIGTHVQLGMQPCGFYARTGLPCAACGMTTSFAYLVRGHLLQSLYAQPFGALLGVLTAAAVSMGLYSAITGRAAYAPLLAMPLRTHLWIWLPLAGLAWVWKIAIVLLG